MFSCTLADILRNDGHDIVRASDVGQSRADDERILEYAIMEVRTLVTLDEHFGDWTVLPLKKHPGVIRVKIHPPATSAIAQRLLPFLRTHDQEQFANNLIILGKDRVRWINTARGE